MINKKARDYASKAKKSASTTEAQHYSKLAFDELFENCEPTENEFGAFASMLILSSETLWKLVLAVPRWAAADSRFHL